MPRTIAAVASSERDGGWTFPRGFSEKVTGAATARTPLAVSALRPATTIEADTAEELWAAATALDRRPPRALPIRPELFADASKVRTTMALERVCGGTIPPPAAPP